MSVLHSRIMAHDAGQGPSAALIPYGSQATPLTMPMATVDYQGETAIYGTAHPLVTPDGAVIAARSHRSIAAPYVGVTVPAGRP